MPPCSTKTLGIQLGAIVHYSSSKGSKCVAAIVVSIRDNNDLNLICFTNTGTEQQFGVPYDEDCGPHTWHYPSGGRIPI